MAEEEHTKEFPDVSQKLAAPKKLSAFEKDRQAALAKEKRAEAENAAALKEFADSFGDEDDDDPLSQLAGGRGFPTGPRGRGRGFGFGSGSGPPRGGYGMPPSGPRMSGPGSLGPIPGPPPPSLKRKRALDEMREAQEAKREQQLAYEESLGESRGTPQHVAQDEEQIADAPRPTVQLLSLPPSISEDEIRSLLSPHLAVHSVAINASSGPVLNAKRSISAVVELSSETTTAQIDTAVSTLRDQYLGFGFYLSISRHLSSAAMQPPVAANLPGKSIEPFGAEMPRDQQGRPSMRNAPPPIDQRGFAPPEYYDSPARSRYGAPPEQDASLSVRPPLEIEAIKAVHTVVDHLLLEPNPERALETEAMLMALPQVQKDERFAFLYDSRSAAGVYYRFILWAPEDREELMREMKRSARGSERIHEDAAIEWVPPYSYVPFPDLKSLAQVVTELDYVSSDEESDDEGAERKFSSGRDADAVPEANEKKHLSPLQRARLTYLLARLPTSNSRLRKGDVARVTNFAINHAGQGAEEIVDMLLLNAAKPFSYSLASSYEDSDQEQDEEDEYSPDEDLANIESPAPQVQKDNKRDEDPSNARLIALYCISDILSASSTAGARNAWKYRQLFESGFKAQKTFEHLGKLDRELAWGRMKAEQWKRKIGVVFGIWEGWSVFSSEVHEELKQSFFDPPLSEEEKIAAQAEAEREEKKKQEGKWAGKFRKVGEAGASDGSASPAPVSKPGGNGTDGRSKEDDIDGEPMADDIDGEPMDDIDGEPMDDDIDGTPLGGLDGAGDEKPKTEATTTPTANAKPSGPRRRMKAEDIE